jgi:hypothetical protein
LFIGPKPKDGAVLGEKECFSERWYLKKIAAVEVYPKS